MKLKFKRILFCVLAVLFIVLLVCTAVLSCLKRDKEPLTANASSVSLNVSTSSSVRPKFSMTTSLGVQNYLADIIISDIPTYYPLIMAIGVISLESASISFSLNWSLERREGIGWSTIESGSSSLSSSQKAFYISFEQVETMEYRLSLSYVRMSGGSSLFYSVRVDCSLEVLFEAGYHAGSANNKDSYDKGHSDGYQVGFQEGKTEGLDEGYNNGFSAGETQGHVDGYNEGYEVGKVDGYELGYSDGMDVGFVNNSSVITYFLAPVATFMEMKLFGIVSLNSVFSVVLFVLIATVFIKLFAGG